MRRKGHLDPRVGRGASGDPWQCPRRRELTASARHQKARARGADRTRKDRKKESKLLGQTWGIRHFIQKLNPGKRSPPKKVGNQAPPCPLPPSVEQILEPKKGGKR